MDTELTFDFAVAGQNVASAKKLLEAQGYAVIKRDRLQSVGAQATISLWTYLQMKGSDEWERNYERNIKRQIAVDLGMELAASPAAQWDKSTPGEDMGTVIRVRTTVVMPE